MCDHFINILAYADDIVLIAPSWRALQHLLNVLQDKATAINMECNVKKTCCCVSTKKIELELLLLNFLG